MEVKHNESQQMMGGMINLLQQMQMHLGTLSASMATLSSGVQQSPSTPPPHISFPTTHSPHIQPTSSQHSIVQNPFRVELKVDIKVFDGRMDAESLETWIQALEVYFSYQAYTDEKWIDFSRLKMGRKALLWWESFCRARVQSGKLPISSWIDFQKELRKNFYPLGYEDELFLKWIHLKQ